MIWALELEFGPRGRDLGLEAKFQALRLRYELSGWDMAHIIGLQVKIKARTLK